MFIRNPQPETTELDKAITDALNSLAYIPAYSAEYAEAMTQLERLHKLKTDNSPKRVSPDTLAIVLGNIAGIAMIVGYERANVVTSKALNFVLKASH